MRVVSIASSRDIGGNIVGMRLATMVLLAPGDEQNVVSAGAADFQSPLGGLLDAHIAQIHAVLGSFGQEQPRIHVSG